MKLGGRERLTPCFLTAAAVALLIYCKHFPIMLEIIAPQY